MSERSKRTIRHRTTTADNPMASQGGMGTNGTNPELTPVETSSVPVYHTAAPVQTPVYDTGSNAKILQDDDSMERGAENGCLLTVCAPENNPVKLIFKILACICAGIVFGLALEKSRVFEPSSIRGQMILERWIMLKMFLAAMATGQLMLVLLSVLPPTRDKFQAALDDFASTLSTKGLVAVVIGAFVLGSGMTLSGACPGMVLAQVGSWTKNSIFTLLGVLVGTFLYGLVAPYVVKITKPKQPYDILTVYEKFKVPYFAVALPMVVLMTVAVILMEVFIDWSEDLDPMVRNVGDNNIFEKKSWPPSISGALIGLMQVTIVLAVGDTLGGSSSYVTLVSQWVVTKRLQEMFPYLAKARCGLGNWWQVFYVLSAMLGAFISAISSDMLAETRGVTIPTAVMGGFMLALGARFASGCTSGHGLSGAGLLFWLSLLAVPVMFAGGIGTAFLMKTTGAVDDYRCFNDDSFCPGTIDG